MQPEERETVIQYSDASDTANVFTCHKGLAQRLLRHGMQPVSGQARPGHGAAWSFEVPKSWVSVRRPRRVNMTPEQRAVVAERMRNLRNPVSKSQHQEEVHEGKE